MRDFVGAQNTKRIIVVCMTMLLSTPLSVRALVSPADNTTDASVDAPASTDEPAADTTTDTTTETDTGTPADSTTDTSSDTSVEVGESEPETVTEAQPEAEVTPDTTVDSSPEEPTDSSAGTDTQAEAEVGDTTVVVEVCVSGSLDTDGDGICDTAEGAEEAPPTDTDRDGIVNSADPDDDGDGIPTAEEDIDGNGTAINDDTDGDGVPNYLESNTVDTDADGAPNVVDADDDGDTVPTAEEETVSGVGADTDHDGVIDILDSDDDGDGIPTKEESVGTNEDTLVDTDADGFPDIIDADDDNDGIPTSEEGGADTDGDTVPDQQEPNGVDTDGDGLANHEDADDDGDGIPTAEEVSSGGSGGGGTYPRRRALPSPVPHYLNPDDDEDGIPTKDEQGDMDGDGYADHAESNIEDIDGDGIVNAEDRDDDGDAVPTNTDVIPYGDAPIECASVDYSASIVNPDGSVRTMDSSFATVEAIGEGMRRISFEDSGSDMDHNDVVLRINSRGCRSIVATIVDINASWRHQIHLTLSVDGVADATITLWEDDHQHIRTPKRVVLEDALGMQVAGTAGVCRPLITQPLRAGSTDVEGVTKLQRFLRTIEGEAIRTDGVFDFATDRAVRAFQEKYAETVLQPWGLTNGTGYVYTTTTKKINDLACAAQFE